MPDFKISTRKNKKYMVITSKGNTIHFGDKRYSQYKDSIGKYSSLNHGDKKRRDRYLKRAKGIRDKEGNLTWKNKESPNYYSIKYLWT